MAIRAPDGANDIPMSHREQIFLFKWMLLHLQNKSQNNQFEENVGTECSRSLSKVCPCTIHTLKDNCQLCDMD